MAYIDDNPYDIAGGITSDRKHVVWYYPISVRVKKPPTFLLDLEPGWYAYPMYKKYLIIEVRLSRQQLLFVDYNFKRFARIVKRLVPRSSGKHIRRLYSGYYYPDHDLYLRIQEEYRNDHQM